MNFLLEYGSEEDDSMSEDHANIQLKESICSAASTSSQFSMDINRVPGGLANGSDRSGTEDFFGLIGTDSDDESDPPSTLPESKIKQIKARKVRSVKVGHAAVEIPDTNFWSDMSCRDVKTMNGYYSQMNAAKICRQSDLIALDTKDGIDTRPPNIKMNLAQDNELISGGTEKQEKTVLFKDTFDGGRSYNTLSGKVKTSNFGKEGQVTKRKLYHIHPKVAPHLHKKENYTHIPGTVEKQLNAHNGVVNRVRWNCPNFSHLFLTASMDTTVKIWNIWTQLNPCVVELRCHTKAVKDAEWSSCGRKIISCGYDKTALLTDVETGTVLIKMHHESFATCCKFHPSNSYLVLTGSHNKIQAWDTRTPNSAMKTFTHKDNFGQVHDLLFSRDGDEFFSCADLVSRDSADRNIIAWHFSSGVILSNQIYQERYTCTRLKLHQTEGHFLAQSNGNYIAIFSISRPYKMNKAKRFEGHKVLGYSIGFDISSDGSHIFSGSSDGKLYCYNSQTGKLIRRLKTDLDVCIDVALHPVLPSALACCSWNGLVQVWH